MTRKVLVYLLGLGAFVIAPSPAVAQTYYHHVHLIVPDVVEGTRWYIDNMGCGPVEGRPDAALCNSTKIYFFGRDSEGPSVGTAVNHISFSFDNLDAKVAELEAAGITFEEPGVRDVPNLFKVAFFTQWGTRIELVEHDGREGFHHIHLSSPNPDETLSWYQEMFGGERTRLQGVLDAVLFSGAVPAGGIGGPRSDVWLLASQALEAVVGNERRAIDHLGFSVASVESTAEALKPKGVDYGVEPGRITDHHSGQDAGRGHLTLRGYSFVTGPDDVWIEIVECFDPRHCEQPAQ